jgi:hypothetical protein
MIQWLTSAALNIIRNGVHNPRVQLDLSHSNETTDNISKIGMDAFIDFQKYGIYILEAKLNKCAQKLF